MLRLQAVFRREKEYDCSRKTLAEMAGVTPALITYYFPKREVLLEEVSRPVLRDYRRRLEQVVHDGADLDDKLRRIVRILIELYTNDANILEIYQRSMRRSHWPTGAAQSELTGMTSMLAGFFASWRGSSFACEFDAAVLQGAIWGMCRFAAQVEANRSPEEDIYPFLNRVVTLMKPMEAAVL